MPMTQIDNLDKWLSGKTVKRVDNSAVNCTTIYCEGGTAAHCEAEYLGAGTIGPIWYEIDPERPVHEQ
jgi:hypothetical protein